MQTGPEGNEEILKMMEVAFSSGEIPQNISVPEEIDDLSEEAQHSISSLLNAADVYRRLFFALAEGQSFKDLMSAENVKLALISDAVIKVWMDYFDAIFN